MSRLHSILVLAAVCAFGGGLAAAQTRPATPGATPTPARSAANTADATFAAWDTDRNGSLSQQEFRNGWEQVRRAARFQAGLRKQFVTIDANKSGAIEPSEYGALVLVKQAGTAAPMSRFDSNKDGKLQLGEYLRLVQALAPEAATKATTKAKPR